MSIIDTAHAIGGTATGQQDLSSGYWPDGAAGGRSRRTQLQVDGTTTLPTGSWQTCQLNARDSEPDYYYGQQGMGRVFIFDYCNSLFV